MLPDLDGHAAGANTDLRSRILQKDLRRAEADYSGASDGNTGLWPDLQPAESKKMKRRFWKTVSSGNAIAPKAIQHLV